jgi:hypothetical protein
MDLAFSAVDSALREEAFWTRFVLITMLSYNLDEKSDYSRTKKKGVRKLTPQKKNTNCPIGVGLTS